jgi:hypothetical protein
MSKPEFSVPRLDEVSDEYAKMLAKKSEIWPAPGSEDTKLGVLMEREVRHGATEVYAGVQA